MFFVWALGLLLLGAQAASGQVMVRVGPGYYGPPRAYYGPRNHYPPPPPVVYAPAPPVIVVLAPYYAPRPYAGPPAYYRGPRGHRRFGRHW